MKIRKSLSISDTMLGRAGQIMQLRGFDDFSEFVSALIREEEDRRGLDREPPPAMPAGLVEELKSSWASSGNSLADKIVSDDVSAVAAKPGAGVVDYKSKPKAARRKATPPAPDSRKKAL